MASLKRILLSQIIQYFSKQLRTGEGFAMWVCFLLPREWLEKGEVTSTILTDVLCEMGIRNFFGRVEFRVPFLLLDSFGLRTEDKFVESTSDPEHEGVTFIRVLCRASL